MATGADDRPRPLRFDRRELRDLAAAWLALSLAFTFFFGGPTIVRSPAILDVFPVMLVTVGAGFLLHELAHKVVAVRFGQLAAFQADYGMLFVAVVSGLAGFIFAAPGAVHHRGRITERQHGLIALAGPVTNLLLAAAFLPVAVVAPDLGGSLIGVGIGSLGVFINLLLAAFNMIPFGPLDGRTVLDWNPVVFAAVFVPSAALTVYLLFL